MINSEIRIRTNDKSIYIFQSTQQQSIYTHINQANNNNNKKKLQIKAEFQAGDLIRGPHTHSIEFFHKF